MKAALLIIGDEILSGRVQDQNILNCARSMKSFGIELSAVSIIGDTFIEIISSLNNFSKEHDLIITSGGLGPTLDDKTKEALSKYLDTEIKKSIVAQEIALNNYKRRQLDFHTSLSSYDFIPNKVTPLNNPNGLAPGLFCEKDKTYIACAPGVPSEFDSMLKEEILPKVLKETKTLSKIESIVIRTMGLPEEKIFGEIDKDLWTSLEAFGSVSSLPMISGVDIVVYLNQGSNWTSTFEKIKVIIENSAIAPHVWSFGDEEIAQTIISVMLENNTTLSTAESCTGGLVSSKLTDIDGASQVLLGGVVSYSNECKINILGVEKSCIEKFGVVSKEVAKQMCVQTSIINKTDYALSLTGLAGSHSFEGHPAGTVFIGVKTPSKVEVHQFVMRGDRVKLKERFALKALFLLLKVLREEN